MSPTPDPNQNAGLAQSGLKNEVPQKAAESLASNSDAFSDLARESDPGLIREFVDFLKYNKKWWLTPILLVTLLLIGAAILLPSPVVPFIYTLF